MAITSENIERAKQIEEQLNQKLSSIKPEDPEYDRTSTNLTNLRLSIQEFTKANTKTDSNGKLIEDAPKFYNDVNAVEGEGAGNYFYEPSVDAVKNALASDPELGRKLSVTSWTDNPDEIHKLTEDSTAYQAVADHLWNQQAQKAKEQGQSLKRYSRVALTENPLDFMYGGFKKYASPLISGAGDVMTMGTSGPVEKIIGRSVMEAAGESPENIQNTLTKGEEIVSEQTDRSTGANIAGTLLGYANPSAPINQLYRAGSSALGYASRSPLGKILTGSSIASGLNTAEGAVQDTAQQVADQKPLDEEFGNKLLNDSAQRAALGFGLGGAGEVLGGMARNAAQSMRSNNPTTQMVKTLEDAGGRVTVDPISPLSVPDNIKANLDAATAARGVRSGTGIAADKVAPAISESLERQVRETYNQAGESLLKYHNSPQGRTPKRVTEPVKFMVDYLTKGKRSSDFGTITDTTPETANEIRKRLLNEVDFKDVSVHEYQNLKERYGDDIISLDPKDADFILGRKPPRDDMPPNPYDTQPRVPAYGNTQQNPFQQNPFRAGAVSEIKYPPALPDGIPGLPEPIGPAGNLNSGIPELPPGQTEALSTLKGNPLAIQLPSVSPSQSIGKGTNRITVIIPKSSDSEKLEMMQKELGSLLQTSDEGWIRQLDESFRKVRDKFDPLPGVTPAEAVLDDGTKVYGLSALQRMHSQAFDKMNEVVKETGINSARNVHNKVKAFGTDDVSDQFLLEEARKIGKENELFEVAGTRVAPILDQMVGVPTSLRSLKQNLEVRALPMLEAVGGVNRNPFINNPNTPQGRIQKYLFEDTAKNLMNTSQGGLGRFGNEVYDETN